MSEKALWKTLKNNLPQAFWMRVETYTESGVPDVFGGLNDICFWLELKMEKHGSFIVRSSQLAWFKNYQGKKMNNAFFLVKGLNSLTLVRPPFTDMYTSGKDVRVPLNAGEILFQCKRPFQWGALLDKLVKYSQE